MTKDYPFFLFTLWTKGEAVERSRRTNPEKSTQGQQHPQEYGQQQSQEYGQQPQEYGGRGFGQGLDDGFTRQANKRDSFNEMLSHRDMHTQVGQNPFLAGESYLNHLKIQENFLRPQNTNVMESKKDG